MQKIAITGADGFIGSHFTKFCVEHGCEVWALVHPHLNRMERIADLKGVHCIVSDIKSLKEKRKEFPEKIETFYHFAWSGVNANDRDDFECQYENMELSLDVLRFAASLKAKRFIMPGSTNEYLYYGKPIDKNAVPSPSNSYGTVKVSSRFLLQDFAKKVGVAFIYAVITGIYAADRKDNNVIFYTIEKLLCGEKPSLTKLEQLWDYVYIDDAVEALYLLGEKGKDGEFYTVGKGDNQPLYKYIEEIRNIINPDLTLGIGEVPYKSDVMTSSCVDLTALERDTGFVPKVEFSEGIRKVIEQMKLELKEESCKEKS